MFKKRQVSDNPFTYKFFEQLPNTEPIYLGKVTKSHDDLWLWESAFGGSAGKASDHGAMEQIQKCARESETIQRTKTRGIQ